MNSSINFTPSGFCNEKGQFARVAISFCLNKLKIFSMWLTTFENHKFNWKTRKKNQQRLDFPCFHLLSRKLHEILRGSGESHNKFEHETEGSYCLQSFFIGVDTFHGIALNTELWKASCSSNLFSWKTNIAGIFRHWIAEIVNISKLQVMWDGVIPAPLIEVIIVIMSETLIFNRIGEWAKERGYECIVFCC